MQDKKRIVIRFNSARDYLSTQDAIKEFNKFKKFKNKNDVYLNLIKLGLESKSTNTKVEETKVEDNNLNDLMKLLQITEAQLRVLFWVMMGKEKPSIKELEKLDVAKLPLLESIKSIINDK